MTELDPCPFCGGKAGWDEKDKAPQCTQCKATIPSAGGILRKYFDKSNYRQYMDAVEFVKERNRMCSTYTPKRCEGGGVI